MFRNDLKYSLPFKLKTLLLEQCLLGDQGLLQQFCVGKSPVWVPVVLAEECFSQYCRVSHAWSELEMPFPGRISVYTWRVMPITAILVRFFFSFFAFNFTLDLNSNFFHFLSRTRATVLVCCFGWSAGQTLLSYDTNACGQSCKRRISSGSRWNECC